MKDEYRSSSTDAGANFGFFLIEKSILSQEVDRY